MTTLARIVVAALLLIGAAPLPGWTQAPATVTNPDATRFEADIAGFEAADRDDRPAPGSVLFVGSSSIRFWRTLEEDFPTARVLNRGFGGSQMSDLVHFVDRVVLPYRPRAVFVYEGDNDLNAGKSPEQVFGDFQEFVRRVHAAQPETRIAILSIKPSLLRWKLVDATRRTNRLLQEFVAKDPRLTYIDVFSPMLNAQGTPRPELFIEDGLHMTPAGYELWESIVEPFVEPYADER